MANGSTTVAWATAEAVRSSGVEAGQSHSTPESRTEKPMVLGEQTALPEVSEGVVGHTIRPPSPPVVPLAVEEDEVEEIEHEEARPQAVRSSVSGAMKLWWWKRRTPPGKSEY